MFRRKDWSLVAGSDWSLVMEWIGNLVMGWDGLLRRDGVQSCHGMDSASSGGTGLLSAKRPEGQLQAPGAPRGLAFGRASAPSDGRGLCQALRCVQTPAHCGGHEVRVSGVANSDLPFPPLCRQAQESSPPGGRRRDVGRVPRFRAGLHRRSSGWSRCLHRGKRGAGLRSGVLSCLGRTQQG